MRTRPRLELPLHPLALALLLVACFVVRARGSETPLPGGGTDPKPPALKTLDLSSLGHPAPTDKRKGSAASLSASPYG